MIQVDTREQNNAHIIKYFINNNIAYIRSKMVCGDYCEFNNPAFVIERKASWLEFANNCGNNHSTFKAELERLDAVSGRMVLLIEDTTPLEKWKSNRTEMTGATMQKIITAWCQKHCLTVMQVAKQDAGQIIYSLLEKEENQK